MTKLTDLCDIQYGYAFDSGAFTDDESYPQLVRIRDVKRGYSETYYNGDYFKNGKINGFDLIIYLQADNTPIGFTEFNNVFLNSK